MGIPGGWELIVVVLLIMVLFGYKKLPEATRSLGKSVRIFKAETKGLIDDDEDDAGPKTPGTTTTTTASVEAPADEPTSFRKSSLVGDEQLRQAGQDRPHQQP